MVERDDALVIALQGLYPGDLRFNSHPFRIQETHKIETALLVCCSADIRDLDGLIP
jgi:hypothetical protein